MTEIGPKTPRVEDIRYLGFLRTFPCCACFRVPTAVLSDAAHIRMASTVYGKRATGAGEKPSDCWAVPLCRQCHITQHSMSEAQFWRDIGVNPFELAIHLYNLGGHPNEKQPKKRKVKIAAIKKPWPKRKFGQ
jgi:hypothetical protein